ncbi:MAG: hypothetical protein Kow0022_13470 [Phycisphaerales bacterium]
MRDDSKAVFGAELLTHDRLLGRRLLLHTRARFAVAPLMVAGALLGKYVVGVEHLNVAAVVGLAVVVGLYNILILTLAGPRCDAARAAESRSVLRALLLASMVLDFLALTAAVWLVGGARSPFVSFYLFHVVISSLLLSRRSAMLAAGLASTLLALLVLIEYSGAVPAPLPLGAVAGSGPLDGRYALTLLVVHPLLFFLVAVLLTNLVRALRQADADRQSKARELARLSAMRREFLRVVLHDINSPIGVVTMLVRHVRQGLSGPVNPEQAEALDRSLRQLDNVTSLLRDMRLLSELESADLSDHMTEVSLTFLIDEVLEELQDLAREHRHTLTASRNDTAGLVWGVPRLLKQAIANYVTNAIKYTPDGGIITIRCIEQDGNVRVEVSDDGIGISEQDQERLFQDFSRPARNHHSMRNVPGIGLGLSLVRRIAEMHSGRVGVCSTPGRGSTFWIELPSCRNAASNAADTSG